MFSRIYEKRLWLGGDEEYSSGDGSRSEQVVGPYLNCINRWSENNNSRSIAAVDLGCGDFHVGSKIYANFKSYAALDVVPALIEKHKEKYSSPGLLFGCIDAIEHELPEGDVIFVRQVLQHLSNRQIMQILPKLHAFRYAIITEHLPAPSQLVRKNLDKPHGGGIRLANGSGVYLDEHPFIINAVSVEILLDVPANIKSPKDGRIVTHLYQFH